MCEINFEVSELDQVVDFKLEEFMAETVYSPDVKPGVLTPNAILEKEWRWEDTLNELGIRLPDYSFNLQFLTNSSVFERYQINLDLYDYILCMYSLVVPQYSDPDNILYGMEHFAASAQYTNINRFAKGWGGLTNRQNDSVTYQNCGNMVYQASNAFTEVGPYMYGLFMNYGVPTLNGNDLVISKPSYMLRGHTNYLNSAAYRRINDVKFQTVVQLYKTPKNIAPSGGSFTTLLDKVAADYKAEGKLK